MSSNPYESPKPAAEAQPAVRFRANPLGLLEILFGSVLVVAVGAATYHSLMQEDRVAYLNWPLIYFELLGIASCLFISFVSLIRALYFFATDRLLKGAVNALVSVLAVVAAFAAIFIDAPTMIYGT
jgi:hypothetical protein